MACFVVPMAGAIGTSIVKKVVKKETVKSWRLDWLGNMFWGGVIALAVEHALHGEIVPWPPFLTAMQNLQDVRTMLFEMAVIGVPMLVVIPLIWVVMLSLVKRKGEVLPSKV